MSSRNRKEIYGEFRRFVTESEGEAKAVKRCLHLTTLNQFTLRQWRRIIEAGPFEILEWIEKRSPFAKTLLEEYPEVQDTLLDGVERRDLIHGEIKVWLRKKGHGAERDEDHPRASRSHERFEERRLMGEMKVFSQDDGRALRAVRGFREQVLFAPWVSVQPKPNWSDEDYSAAAARLRNRLGCAFWATSRAAL